MGFFSDLKKLFSSQQETTISKSKSTISVEFNNSQAERQEVKPIPYENNIHSCLVLHWISKKKKGYERATNKFPKWFLNDYYIDFNTTLEECLIRGLLSEDNGIVKITTLGEQELKDKDFIVYIKEHDYNLSVEDFTSHPHLHKVSNNDIAWGVFNKRILEYSQKQMWGELKHTYYCMSLVLIEESKYEQALDFIFASTFIQTSGMGDNNELSPIDKHKKKLPNGCPNIFLMEINNYTTTVPLLDVNSHLNLTDEDIKTKYLTSEIVESLTKLLPFFYFNKSESCWFMLEAFHKGEKKGIFPLTNVSQKLKFNKPDPNSTLYFYASVENKVRREFKS